MPASMVCQVFMNSACDFVSILVDNVLIIKDRGWNFMCGQLTELCAKKLQFNGPCAQQGLMARYFDLIGTIIGFYRD